MDNSASSSILNTANQSSAGMICTIFLFIFMCDHRNIWLPWCGCRTTFSGLAQTPAAPDTPAIGKQNGYATLLLKLARSSASSQSNVLLFSGSSPSFLHSSVKKARFSGFFIMLPASTSSDQALISAGFFFVPLASSQYYDWLNRRTAPGPRALANQTLVQQ